MPDYKVNKILFGSFNLYNQLKLIIIKNSKSGYVTEINIKNICNFFIYEINKFAKLFNNIL